MDELTFKTVPFVKGGKTIGYHMKPQVRTTERDRGGEGVKPKACAFGTGQIWLSTAQPSTLDGTAREIRESFVWGLRVGLKYGIICGKF